MRAIRWMLFFLVLSSGAWASRDPFAALTEWTAKSGRYVSGNSDIRYVERFSSEDLARPHTHDIFVDVGVTDLSGRYSLSEVEAYSEDWRLRADGDWEVDEWNWTAFTDGTLLRLRHNLMVIEQGGFVRSREELPTGDASDPDETAHWQAKLAEWYLLVP